MNDRDTLAELINPHQPAALGYWCSCGLALGCHIDQHRADIVIAAGWRPPVRTLTTAELDDLPVRSVVLDHEGDPWQRHSYGWTCVASAGDYAESEDLIVRYGPVTVVHVPAEAVTGE